MRRDVGHADVSVVKLTTATRRALLTDLQVRMGAKRGYTVATLNLDHIVKLRSDAAFRAAYDCHSHVVADGNPIVWLHRLAGGTAELITGSDLVEPLIELARSQNVPVAFFGSTQEGLDVAAERLSERCPGIRIVARLSPPFGFDPTSDEADACVAKIASSGARLCLIALGAPKQEMFAARAAEKLPGCGFVSVGAGLDFIAGTQTRAPQFVRRLALEWLWRLANDRRRLARRYINCALILPGLIISALNERFRTPAAPMHIPPVGPPDRAGEL